MTGICALAPNNHHRKHQTFFLHLHFPPCICAAAQCLEPYRTFPNAGRCTRPFRRILFRNLTQCLAPQARICPRFPDDSGKSFRHGAGFRQKNGHHPPYAFCPHCRAYVPAWENSHTSGGIFPPRRNGMRAGIDTYGIRAKFREQARCPGGQARRVRVSFMKHAATKETKLPAQSSQKAFP